MAYLPTDRPPQDNPSWSNAMSPGAGVFLAMSNHRGTPKVVEDASAIHWWEWQKTVRTENPDATDFSGLSTYVRFTIVNEGTQAILFEAVAGKGDFQTKSVSFTPDDPNQDSNGFWAILGTDNGKGIMYLLTDYKNGMKGKGITSINVQLLGSNDKTADWMFWATIG